MKRCWPLLLLSLLSVSPIEAAQKQSVFVRGAVDAGGFPDQDLEESARDITRRLTMVNLFAPVKSEKEADLLVVVTSRFEDKQERTIVVTVSVKDGADWKPGTKITEVCKCQWTLTAEKIVFKMAKWEKDRKK